MSMTVEAEKKTVPQLKIQATEQTPFVLIRTSIDVNGPSAFSGPVRRSAGPTLVRHVVTALYLLL